MTENDDRARTSDGPGSQAGEWGLVAAGIALIALAAVSSQWPDGSTSASALMGLSVVGILWTKRQPLLWARLRAPVGRMLQSRRFWFWFAQCGLVAGCLAWGAFLREWVLGEQFSGTVIAVEHPGVYSKDATRLTIWDPRAEREVKVPQGSWAPSENSQVGDFVSGVIMRSNPDQIASRGQLAAHLAGLAALLELTAVWPFCCWRLYGCLSLGDPRKPAFGGALEMQSDATFTPARHRAQPTSESSTERVVPARQRPAVRPDHRPRPRVRDWPVLVWGAALMVIAAMTWGWATAFDDHATRDLAIWLWALGIVVACLGWWAGVRRLPSDPMRPRRVFFWVVEVTMLSAVLGVEYHIEWLRHGAQLSGVVVDVEVEGDDESDLDIVAWTVRDPASEREVRVASDMPQDQGTVRIGDPAVAVIRPGDPTRVATREDLGTYIGRWGVLPVLAVLWPIEFRWRYRRRVLRNPTSGAGEWQTTR